MFKGKVTIIKNINGKEEKIEKEFKSPDEYQAFLREQNMQMADPKLSLSEWGALGDFVERIFEDKLNDFFLLDSPEFETVSSELPVELEKYEKEAAKIEKEKEKKEAKKAEIKRAIDKLKSFIKTFEKEGKKDLAKSAKEDMKKLEDERNPLKV